MQTDTPTLGAVRAIEAAQRGNTVLLAAFGGVPEFIDLIRQGKIVASGMRQPYLMGVRSAQAMFDHLDGKTPPNRIAPAATALCRSRPSGTVWSRGPLRR